MKKCPLTLLVVVLSMACGERRSEGIDSMLREDVYGDAIPVETLALEPQEFADRFQVAGVVAAEEDVTVSAEISGRVLKVHYEIGDAVGPGALLVTLDSSEIRARIKRIEAELARAATQLEWARKDLTRQERLYETEVAAERARDDAQRLVDTTEDDVAAAEADLELARVELARTLIRSPIRGSIAERHVALGEYVREGTPLYDVVATDRVKFVFSLAERDVTAVEPGETLPVRIDAFPGRELAGPVRAVSPSGARETRTFRVEIEIENDPDRPLLPGMSGRAEVVRRRFSDVYLLPEEAILRDATGSYVYLADESVARRAVVEVLSQVGDKAVVSTGLGREPEVVILGQAALSPETPLRVRRRHETIPEARFD